MRKEIVSHITWKKILANSTIEKKKEIEQHFDQYDLHLVDKATNKVVIRFQISKMLCIYQREQGLEKSEYIFDVPLCQASCQGALGPPVYPCSLCKDGTFNNSAY